MKDGATITTKKKENMLAKRNEIIKQIQQTTAKLEDLLHKIKNEIPHTHTTITATKEEEQK